MYVYPIELIASRPWKLRHHGSLIATTADIVTCFLEVERRGYGGSGKKEWCATAIRGDYVRKVDFCGGDDSR
ncbi:unnamed protein product [Cochlearia groenlandica]